VLARALIGAIIAASGVRGKFNFQPQFSGPVNQISASMERLKIEQEIVGEGEQSVLVLTSNGYIDASNVDEFESQFNDALDGDGRQSVVVSLEGVEYINSSGLGVLISASQKLAADGFFCLAAVPEKIARIVRLLGFGDVVKIFDTVDQAVAAISEGEAS
jgi:anti-anti-sigma factor